MGGSLFLFNSPLLGYRRTLMGKLKDKLFSGVPVITAEVTPPKGAGIKKLIKNAERLNQAINQLENKKGKVRELIEA